MRAKFEATGSCYIVVSEGARYADGTYLSAGDTAHDGFAHAVLGGAAQTVKQMIVDTGIVPRGVVQDLSRAARSSNFAQSLVVDVTEAYDLGMSAHMRSADPAFTGQVVGIRRNPEAAAEGRYEAELFAGPASEFANFVKRFPAEWILPNYQGITPEAVAYFRPLIEGEPKLVMKGGIPATISAVQQALTKPAPRRRPASTPRDRLTRRALFPIAVVARNVRFSLKAHVLGDNGSGVTLPCHRPVRASSGAGRGR